MLPWSRAPEPRPPLAPLEPLERQQRLATNVLRVHSLSGALSYEPHAPLRVDAARWWDELQQQSAAAAQQRHSRKRRLQPSAKDQCDAKDECVEALVRVLHSVQRLWAQRQDALDAETSQVADDIQNAIAEVGARLLDAWRRAPDSNETSCSIDVVNVLLQVDSRVGAFHAFHDHKLCASTAQRLFRASPAWTCSRCERSWETHGATAPILVFSCPACSFTICRECYTRVPNASVELQVLALAREVFQPLQAQQFLPLVMRRLADQDNTLFASLAPKIAIAARERLHDLLLYRSDEMVPMMEMVLELFSIPNFPRIFIEREPQLWLPVYISSAKLRLHSFLGPLMWWTSMSDEPGEINLTPDGRRDGSAMALTLQWHEGCRLLRKMLAQLFQLLLDAKTQDPFVVDAMLTYLATTIVCFQSYRSSGSASDDLYDGYLVNISSALVHVALAMLATMRESLQTTYHEGFVSRRVYHHKVEPLRKPSQEDEAVLRAADDARVLLADNETSEKRKAGDKSADNFYYPHNSKHFGVLCDFCNGADFVGLRYKCAICDDADICASCYNDFSRRPVQDDAAQEAQRALHPDQFHCTDHLFLRLDVPVPLIAANHYDPFECDLKSLLFQAIGEDASRDTADALSQELVCAECDIRLDAFDVYYRCSNCIHPRFVCPSCLDQEERHHDPNKVHLPGHVYMGIPRPWRQHFNPRGPGLLSRGLVYPACIYPRERFNTETELLYMTVESLHVGPLHALSKLLTVVKETHELRSFCACEEQRVAYEKRQQQLQATERRRPKLSAHYAASQARLADLAATRLMAEMHLLETSNVVDWITFYSRTCRWLLEIASSAQNPFKTILTHFSSAFSSFPEHFFFDVCDIVHVLTLDGTSHSGSGTGGVDYQKAMASDSQAPQVVEPILVMLVQLIATRKCTRNPHLRVQAAKALSSLLGFYAKTNALVVVLRKVFHRTPVLRDSAVQAVLQFHEDMEGYHLRNNGLVFNNNAGNGDHLLWGFLSIRVTTVLLLRFMWQFSDQHVELARAFRAKNRTQQQDAAMGGESEGDSHTESRLANQVSMLLTGLWSDAAKLLEESNGKVSVLTQLADVREALLEGRQIQLPFRPSMLEGYIALHSKHLRISMRMLVEVLELLSWIADNTQLKRAMLKPELTDQCACTTSFLVASIASAYKSDALDFTWHHLEDTKRVFANLVFMVSRCAAMENSSEKAPSPSAFWSVVQDSAATMLRFIGDVEVHNRWTLNRAVVRLETAHYLGDDTGEGAFDHRKRDAGVRRTARRDDKGSNRYPAPVDDFDENDALALLEEQSAQALTALNSSGPAKGQRGLARQLGTRFVSALAKDGRFDYELFLGGCDLLLRRANSPSGKVQDNDREYELVGFSWMALFTNVLRRCQDMVTLIAAMDELLADIPEEFLDPLLNTIMTDPVRLPSGNIVDRAVIERHLLSANRVDPFTREPLTVAMLEPCEALRREIRSYLQRKLQHLDTQKEDVLASWGVGWDCIFDVTGEAAM